MSEHSPLPWTLIPSDENHGPYVINSYGQDVADLYAMSNPFSLSVRNGGDSRPIHFSDADANAEFIVRACNTHDELVAALREAHLQLVYLDSRFSTGTTPAVQARIAAAIAKAEGRS